MVAGKPLTDLAVPASVLMAARGRRVRPVWENEPGGVTFEVGAGPERCFVKWTPMTSGIDLTDEVTRLSWAVAPEASGELVGFAYGVALKPDTQWWSGTTEPLPDELTAEWNGRTFAIIDLAVRADHRKRGIGRALLDALLASRQERRATLTVQPVATDTKEFYAYLGWQWVGTTKAPAGAVAPFFDLYLLPLHAKA